MPTDSLGDGTTHTAQSRFTRRSLLQTGALATFGAAAVYPHLTTTAEATADLSIGEPSIPDLDHLYTAPINDITFEVDVLYTYQASVDPDTLTIRLEVGPGLHDTSLIGFHQDNSGGLPLSDTAEVTVDGPLTQAPHWNSADFNLGSGESNTTYDVAVRVVFQLDGPDGPLIEEETTTTTTHTIERPEDDLSSFDVDGTWVVDEDE